MPYCIVCDSQITGETRIDRGEFIIVNPKTGITVGKKVKLGDRCGYACFPAHVEGPTGKERQTAAD